MSTFIIIISRFLVYSFTNQQTHQSILSFRYAWQFITLAGFHSNGLIVTKLARSFGDEGMLAYVRDIQRQEKVEEVELLKHQKWSGAELVDGLDGQKNVVSGGQSSTTAACLGAGDRGSIRQALVLVSLST